MPPGFDPGGFDCGDQDINEYLNDGRAAFDEAASVARTYLIWDGKQLVGFLTILADAIKLATKERPEGVRYGSAPAVKLGRMGVCRPYQDKGVGTWILKWVIGYAKTESATLGVRYVTLDAKPTSGLREWYERRGFKQNEQQTQVEKILRNFWRKVSMDEELPHTSMRFDIMLEADVPAAES